MNHFIALGVILGLASPASADVPLRPADFAYGIPIEIAGDAPFHEFAVPLSVYESVTRTDLGDLRVFNARDEVVPHALRRIEPAKVAGAWTALALFPVRGNNDRSPNELTLRVDRNTAGSIVRVHSSAAAANAPVSFYIVETKTADKPIRALELNWKDSSGEGFAGRLAVDASDDLQNWRGVVGDAPVLRLRHAGESLDRRQIVVAALKTKYLRLRWIDPTGAAPLLTQLRVEHLSDAAPPERQWLAMLPAMSGERRGEYLYTLAGKMPVDRVRIRLPQVNAVANAELGTRAERTAPWQRRAGGLVYRVNKNGTDVVQDDFTLWPVASAREWRLTLSQKDGGLGDEPPVIEAGWLPQTLVFSARGAGPYRLAYGKSGLTPGDASIEQLFNVAHDGQPKFAAQPARLGTRESLGGEERLTLSLKERSWRTWLLWAVLGAGVLMLGWMATRLVRQMKPQE